ncbi:MAG: hypothetical protein ACI9J3_003754 [Parvicellaceae bacterium]|jgi:hypothetical protein
MRKTHAILAIAVFTAGLIVSCSKTETLESNANHELNTFELKASDKAMINKINSNMPDHVLGKQLLEAIPLNSSVCEALLASGRNSYIKESCVLASCPLNNDGMKMLISNINASDDLVENVVKMSEDLDTDTYDKIVLERPSINASAMALAKRNNFDLVIDSKHIILYDQVIETVLADGTTEIKYIDAVLLPIGSGAGINVDNLEELIAGCNGDKWICGKKESNTLESGNGGTVTITSTCSSANRKCIKRAKEIKH